ncbi:MAG: hypothetical protein ACYC6G_16025 [Desulfobaccales bacterium]
MRLSRNSRRLGMAFVGLILLPVLVMVWTIPCHADGHKCGGDCTHSQCCGGHSMPLLSAVNPAPIVRHSVSPYHTVEVYPALRIFASCIYRPPQA